MPEAWNSEIINCSGRRAKLSRPRLGRGAGECLVQMTSLDESARMVEVADRIAVLMHDAPAVSEMLRATARLRKETY